MSIRAHSFLALSRNVIAFPEWYSQRKIQITEVEKDESMYQVQSEVE